jgi:reactive intermediate/imine deaminase
MRLITLSLLFLAAAFAADRKAVLPAGSNPAGPYSPGIVAGDTLYISGTVGRDKANKYPELFEDEVALALDNIDLVLKEAGYTFADAVSVQVYLTDITLFDRMNKVYMKYFPEPRPARTTVGISKLAGPGRVEITVTAFKKKAAK